MFGLLENNVIGKGIAYMSENEKKENIRDSKNVVKEDRRSIEDIFEGYEGEYTPIEVDWGAPKGKEIW